MLTPTELRGLLGKALDGEPWHGASAFALIADLSMQQAAARPLAGAHTIWEIVLHMTAWHNEVGRRLGGAEPAEPLEGDWPEVGEPDTARWEHARDELIGSGRRLARRLESVDAAAWRRPVGNERSPEVGTGVTHAEMVLGVLQHDAYHTGQIGLLRKLIAEKR